MKNFDPANYEITLAALACMIFLLFFVKNRSQTHLIFRKYGKLLDLSLNEICSLKDDLHGTTFPFISRMILFCDLKKELLVKINDSIEKEKFLSNIINCLEIIHDYSLGKNKTKLLIKEILFRYSWRIFKEIESYEKPEKPHIITSLLDYFKIVKDKKFIFIEDELRIRLASLIVKSNKLFEDQTKLIVYLGNDELEMIKKLKVA